MNVAPPSHSEQADQQATMLKMGLGLAVAVFSGMATVLLARVVARRTFTAGRTAVALTEVAVQIGAGVSAEVIAQVWTAVGKAYRIDPKFIKPDDTLARLSALDSWDLGLGEDKLDAWLRTQGLGVAPEIQTVQGLAEWVQSARRPSA